MPHSAQRAQQERQHPCSQGAGRVSVGREDDDGDDGEDGEDSG